MQDSSENKVVSLFNKPLGASQQEAANQPAETQSPEHLFQEVMRKNAEQKKRMTEERLKANRSVLRSYRIKS